MEVQELAYIIRPLGVSAYRSAASKLNLTSQDELEVFSGDKPIGLSRRRARLQIRSRY